MRDLASDICDCDAVPLDPSEVAPAGPEDALADGEVVDSAIGLDADTPLGCD